MRAFGNDPFRSTTADDALTVVATDDAMRLYHGFLFKIIAYTFIIAQTSASVNIFEKNHEKKRNLSITHKKSSDVC